MKSRTVFESDERRRREGELVVRIPRISKEEIEILYMFRRYPIEKPWRNEFNKFSVVKPNWHVINKEEKIVLEDKDTRPLLVDCRFNRSGEPEEDEKKFQYREYRILTYGHWLSCPIGQTLPFFKSKSDVFPSRLIDAATLPRVNRKTFEMFEEDVLIKERKGIFDE